MYGLVRAWLLRKDAEDAHDWALSKAAWASRHDWALSWLRTRRVEDPDLEREVLGLTFPNPVGLAAGFDKDGVAVPAMAALGFGFVEVGTVTPEPQAGNPRPRMWRHRDRRALVNRLGFPSRGRHAVAENLAGVDVEVPVGINVGPNRDTEPADTPDDVRACLETLWDRGDYFVFNVSSPNTPWLRDLEAEEAFRDATGRVLDARDDLGDKPLLVKISPDRAPAELDALADAIDDLGVDGVVATNTTDDDEVLPGAEEGGISGAPLAGKAEATLTRLADRVDVPLIGCGGILEGRDAADRIEAGADLLQCYTALVYRGPYAAARILEELPAARTR